MPGLLTRARLSQLDTVRVPVVARLHGPFAQEARHIMRSGETEDHLFLRLLLFWQHANREDSDTALVDAYERSAR